MWKKRVEQIFTFCLALNFLMLPFWGGNLIDLAGSAERTSYQPNNAFITDQLSGSSEQADAMYGWNMTYLDDFNNDARVDLVISAPWYDQDIVNDIGAVFIFFSEPGDIFEDLNQSAADVVITGEFDGDKFGWSVADAGDVNNDGVTDLLVGAPGALTKRGKAYIIYGGELQTGTYNVKDLPTRILNSQTLGLPSNARYGSSVAGIGDLNDDGYDDVLVGAPGADSAAITYGYKNKVKLYPNLWDDDPGSMGVVTFDNGVNNGAGDSNTWGLDGADDGWDWIDSFSDPTRLYGHTDGAQFDNANVYAPLEDDGPDAQGKTMGNRTALEIMIGRNHTNLNPNGADWNWDPASSAAWGIEFKITKELYKYVRSNSTISLAFDYETFDSTKIYNNSNLSRNFVYTLRSRIWNNSGSYYLGSERIDGETYVFYKQDNWNVPAWGPIFGTFEWDITEFITGPGSYYWDFGCYFPQAWSVRYDDGITAFFDNITMSICNERNVMISGVHNSGFGTSVTGLGDLNDDGTPDMLIGAPAANEGHVALIYGRKQFNFIESATSDSVILTGDEPGDLFGYSITDAGDVDNDGTSDVIIGAPGGNYAHLYYGSTLNSGIYVPDLWEIAEDSETPQIEFDSGLKTTGNTPGHSGADDGWDVWNGVYGYQDGASPGSSVKYNGADGIDPDQVELDKELIIAIGGGLGGGSTAGATPDSGAYGIKFKITNPMASALGAGGRVVLSYDWSFENYGLDQDETVWIKTFIRDGTNHYSLGWDLDQFAGDAENKDDSKEIFWADTPYSHESSFIQECTGAFSAPGYYYLDLGAKVRDYWWENSAWEDGVFHFDNICLRINPAPDVKFIGQLNSSFGYSVGLADKLNIDEYGDIVIGAPNYDSVNGENSGAVFGFIMGSDPEKMIQAESAEFIRYGEKSGDEFGWAVLGTRSLDSDEFTEVLTSAIKYDSTVLDTGKIYLLSISKNPRIKIHYPNNGDTITGEIVLKATVKDPDNNIDTTLGVFFYYSTDVNDWELIGNVKTPTVNDNCYELIWNTSSLADSNNYNIKAWVQDLMLQKGQNIISELTVDNQHPPAAEFKNPKNGGVINGVTELRASVKDSELDVIGGGINTSKGVEFYFSEDGDEWVLIDIRHTGTDNIFTVEFDTTIYPDGEYWFKVIAADSDGLEIEHIINAIIDNPSRRPSIELLNPLNVTELTGTVVVKAKAFDFDRDINNSGISFYLSKDKDMHPIKWYLIGNDPEATINSNGEYIYSYEWDTNTEDDDWYSLKAVVNDTSGLRNESIEIKFAVHNRQNNQPYIKLISPVPGSVADVTEIITAYVRDLEDDLDAYGVSYYYSSDKVHWRFLGTTNEPRYGTNEYYDFAWATDIIPDGWYWLNVSVSDDSNHEVWDISDDTVFVHNTEKNPPVLKIISPMAKQHINGTFKVTVLATDLESNINNIGVRLFYSIDGIDWIVISNIQNPTPAKGSDYEFNWDTTQYPDGIYWLKAEAKDYTDLKGEYILNYFVIHNKNDNSPAVKLIPPGLTEFSGTVTLNATVFDLENNINSDGVKFYYSSDNITWHFIGKDSMGVLLEELVNYYELKWNTELLSDGRYWLRAEATDKTDKMGFNIFTKQIIVHNNMNNPPEIKLKQPNLDIPLAKIQSIIVDVLDFEDDIERVMFFYSVDNNTWILIDTVYQPSKGYVYMTRWDNGEINNGFYYLKVVAIDKYGNQQQLTAGPFQVTTGKEKEVRQREDIPSWIMLMISVMICIVIVIFVVLMLMRRSKRREEELIEEVSSEMLESIKIQGEIGEPQITDNKLIPQVTQTQIVDNYYNFEPNTNYPEFENDPISEISNVNQAINNELNHGLNDEFCGSTEYQDQYTDMPEVETIESYKQQVQTWKAEGYDVGSLEGLSTSDEMLFAKEFPNFSSKISRLKNIASKLNTLDTVGYEHQVQAIKAKIYETAHVNQVENEFKNLESKQCFTPNLNPTLVSPKGGRPTLPNMASPNIPRVAPVLDFSNESIPTPTVDFEPVQPTEVPNDYEMPLGVQTQVNIDLVHHEELEFQESPYANVQTQSLEDEINGKAKIIEIPDESK